MELPDASLVMKVEKASVPVDKMFGTATSSEDGCLETRLV
jgi:hypothetical protein